ncbi:hypothetical protein Cgig2_010296 [Carnegiea gigantea]|uniref:Uncharacterized protein n=1 Tax=Carnegiea gigantea TaxID=171969 RepID=A0A9Q1QIU9_9CARY|nr:hypothetical protein Cgig2_010296 [Carnegiea gigantea]
MKKEMVEPKARLPTYPNRDQTLYSSCWRRKMKETRQQDKVLKDKMVLQCSRHLRVEDWASVGSALISPHQRCLHSVASNLSETSNRFSDSLILMHIETLNNSSIGKIREIENFDSFKANDLNVNVSSDGLKGLLLIGGVRGRVGDQELQDIKSRVGCINLSPTPILSDPSWTQRHPDRKKMTLPIFILLESATGIMSFRSKRTRPVARGNETTRGTNAEHTILEENVQTNPIHGRNPTQFTTASNIPLSSQNQRLPNSSNETQRQSRCLEDDEEDADDLRNGETCSQHSQIPDWNDTIEFDEQEKVRGGHVLVWLAGDIAKNGDLCPIDEKNRHKVDKQKFVLPPNEIVNKKVLRRVGKAWRNHRYLLKKQYKVLGKTRQDVKDKVPDHVIKDQWINLQLSNQGREACASQDHYHTTGSKSFAMKRDELEKETGRKFGLLEVYIASHKRKDGSFKEDSASKDFVDIVEALIAEHMTDSASAKDVEDEVFHELMYRSQSEQDKKY